MTAFVREVRQPGLTFYNLVPPWSSSVRSVATLEEAQLSLEDMLRSALQSMLDRLQS